MGLHGFGGFPVLRIWSSRFWWVGSRYAGTERKTRRDSNVAQSYRERLRRAEKDKRAAVVACWWRMNWKSLLSQIATHVLQVPGLAEPDRSSFEDANHRISHAIGSSTHANPVNDFCPGTCKEQDGKGCILASMLTASIVQAHARCRLSLPCVRVGFPLRQIQAPLRSYAASQAPLLKRL